MKFSTVLSATLILFPTLQGVSAGLVQRQNGGKNNGQNGGQNNGQNGGNNGGNNGGQNNGDPQTSLTLDPKVIAPGFAQNGQDPPVAGQVASLTSTNNFINFCLTVPDKPITNGQQLQGGSCNPAPMGVIPSVDKMPSCKFVFPKNTQTIPADQAFTFQLAMRNLVTGNFVNAQKNYFSAPQTVDGSGVIVGHSHITCDSLTSIDQTTPNDPQKFVFFKGLNDAAQNGVLTAAVDKGLPAGAYRCCTINSSANHTPAIAPVAQHGPLDDCIYFTATPGGAPAGGNAGAGAGQNNGGNAGAGNDANGGNAGAANGGNAGAGNGANGGNAGAGNGGNGANGGNAGATNGGNAGAGNGANGGNAGAGAGNAGAGNGGNGANGGNAGATNGGDAGAGNGANGGNAGAGAGNVGAGKGTNAGAGNGTTGGNAGAANAGAGNGATGGNGGQNTNGGQGGQNGGRGGGRQVRRASQL